MNRSILIIGRISSGKSTLAKAIQDSVSNSKIVSFGEYLKDYSEKRKWKYDRTFLQDLGQKFIGENPNDLLKEVVDFNKSKEDEILIFEGVRHQLILEAIRKYYPVILSIYLDIDVHTRFGRYSTRNKNIDNLISWEEFLKSDNHKVELEIESLKDDCDLILGDESLFETVKQIRERINL